MAEVKKITYDGIKSITAEHNFDIDLMLKDYYVTLPHDCAFVSQTFYSDF